MAYLVVAYPKIEQSDFDWIQKYREQNDARYFNVVGPHFTLLFSVDDIEKDDFISEAKKQISDVKSFEFELKVATINKDSRGGYFHEFLVPEKGYSNIVKIHDKLYSGLFAPHLRYEIDYIPHIGIGNSDDVSSSKRRVDELNSKYISIKGFVDSVTIIEYADGKVTDLENIPLL